MKRTFLIVLFAHIALIAFLVAATIAVDLTMGRTQYAAVAFLGTTTAVISACVDAVMRRIGY